MKKIILTLIVWVLTIPSISFATSGACSSHGGVDCSAGASLTGKVQCNDGWVNSSVFFSSSKECNTQEADIREIDYKISKINFQISQLEISRDQAVNNQREFLAHIGALRTDGNAQGGLDAVSQKYQSQIDLLNIDKNYLNKLKKSLKAELKEIEDQEPTNTYSCPASSHTSIADSTKCECDSGYQLSETKDSCVIIPVKTKDELCKIQFGIKGNWDGLVKEDGKFNCKCSPGYVIGTNKQCVTLASWCSEKYGSDIKTEGGECACPDGYRFNKESQICKKDISTKELATEISRVKPETNSENIKPTSATILNKEVADYESEEKIKWYKRIWSWFF